MTISLAAALALVEKRCVCFTAAEKIALGTSLGRILAEDIVAPINVPASDNSAVDGYGFRHADLGIAREHGLRIVGVAAAGRAHGLNVGPGEAARIFTGAIPPSGVDAIAMQEESTRIGDRLRIDGDIPLHANIRRAGEDIARGTTVLAAGARLEAVQLGLLASLGLSDAPARRRLRVAVLSAGDELIDPGDAPGPGAIHDANRPVLLALLRRMDIDATDLGIMPDDPARIRATLEMAAAGHDAIVTSAGVSVGDEDHLRDTVESLGALDFWSVAIKPGKPFAFGHVAGVPFFGLPGNPVAMMITFLMLGRPGLLRLMGAAARPPLRFPVEAGFTLKRRPERREFLRCAVRHGPNGLIASRFGHGGSGILSSMAGSDGLLEIAEAVTDIAPGDRLPFIPFSEFGL
jgi:molybdopterin molybdotransferase